MPKKIKKKKIKKKEKQKKKKEVPRMERVLLPRACGKLCHRHQGWWHERQFGMKKQQRVNSLFKKIHALCKSPASCYLDFHSYILGGRFLSLTIAAESFCMKDGRASPDPLKTTSIDGDCWIRHLSKLDVTCALLDCQNVERNVLFFFFKKTM